MACRSGWSCWISKRSSATRCAPGRITENNLTFLFASRSGQSLTMERIYTSLYSSFGGLPSSVPTLL